MPCRHTHIGKNRTRSMSLPTTSAEKDLPISTDSACLAEPWRVDPRLSAIIQSDYEALQTDMRQVNDLAAHFQRRLAGKSDDFVLLNQILENTREDLAHLHASIAALRAERHRLANEAMKAEAYKVQLASVTGERSQLRVDLEVVRKALAASGEEMARSLRHRDKHVADLTVENALLKQRLLEKLRRSVEPPRSSWPDFDALESLPAEEDAELEISLA
jgi:hypothetical protein